MVIGLTGGMGTGKSTAARIFEERGFNRIDCDEIVHSLLSHDGPAKGKIVERFGSAVLDSQGSIDRAALGEIVFSDEERLKELESILHPLVYDIWNRAVGEDTEANWVVEIPLLFEKNLQNRVDFTVCVFSDLSTQVERLKRKGMGRAQSLARIERQMPVSEKAENADYVLLNEGSLEFLEEQIATLLTGI